MDKNEVKACIRALLSSSSVSYTFKTLLFDFKNTCGCDLPLFEFPNALEFLKSLKDTIQLCGDPGNPKVCLIESKKSSHITSLVDRQKNKFKHYDFGLRRIIIPNNEINHPPLVNPKSFDNSKINQSNTFKSNLYHSFTNSNIENHSMRNLSKVLGKNDKNTLRSIPPKLNSCEDKSVDKNKVGHDKVCLFKDISDSESCYSTGEDSSTRSSSGQPLNYVNDGMKNKLKKLIKEFPDGLWCCDLPDRFHDMHNFVLDYREFGYTSLIQMVSELPDVFRCVRPGNEDWIVFDASVPSSSEEKKIIDFKFNAVLDSEIKSNLKILLFSASEFSSNLGVEVDEIPNLYKKMFDRSLDFQSLGFKNLKSFLSSLEGSLLNIYNVNKKLIVVPMLKQTVHSPLKWEEALPPITAENDIFYEIFPQDVVGPEESFFELDLKRHIAVGQTVDMCVAEVWSPSKFYVQLNKFKDRLNKFMDDLQNFYNVCMNKYKMPDVTIRPKQVCVGLYNSDPEFPEEWHRAEILKVINDKTVSVNFVDYGTVTRVKKSQLRFLHRKFWSFPVQAFLASLAGVSPVSGEKRWPVPVSKKFLELLRVPFLKAEMTDIDFKKPSMKVILYDPFQNPVSNINLRLVNEKLARADGILVKKQPEIFGEFDIPSLENNVPRPYRTIGLKVVPDSKTTLTKKPLETTKVKDNFEFDEGLDFIGKEIVAKNKFEIKKESSKTSHPESHQVNPYSHETNPNSLSKSETLLPGIGPSPLLMNLNQVPFFMFEQLQNEVKKKINLLAVELLSTNFSIKQVALTNLELGLKIATEMAEAYVYSLFPNTFSMYSVNDYDPVMLKEDLPSSGPEVFNTIESQNVVTTNLTSGDGTNNPPVPEKCLNVPEEIKVPEVSASPNNNGTATNSPSTIITIENHTDSTGSTDTSTTITTDSSTSANNTITTVRSIGANNTITTDSSTSANNTITTDKTKTEDCVVKLELGGKNLHLVKLENKKYFCVNEILRSFTAISNQETADRVLQTKRVNYQYKILTRKTDEEILKALKRHEMLHVLKKKKNKKLEVYLLDAKDVVSYLKTFGCFIEIKAEIEDLLKNSAPSVTNKS